MAQSKELDLLLIGKTGNGKSSTGNSILNRQIFKTSGSSSSETRQISKDYSDYKGRVINVVDSPGVCDTAVDKADSDKMVTEALNKAIFLNPQGYHALIIVIKYGNRFTGEENDAIEFLKQVFGPNFVRDFCIIVMCRGDDFIADHETTGVTFEYWCQEQSGPLKNLIDECGGRIVLFNNRAKDRQSKEKQLDKLINLIDNLTFKGRRYRNLHFEEASKTKEAILKDANGYIIQDESMREASLILQKLEDIQSLDDENYATIELNTLKKRCQKLVQETKPENIRGDTTAQQFIDFITSLNRIVDLEIHFYKKMSREKNKNEKYKEDLKKRHKEEIDAINKQLINQLTVQKKEMEQNETEYSKNTYSKIETHIGQTVKEIKAQLWKSISGVDVKTKTSINDDIKQINKSEVTDLNGTQERNHSEDSNINGVKKCRNIELVSTKHNISDLDPSFGEEIKDNVTSQVTHIVKRQLQEKKNILENEKKTKEKLEAQRLTIHQQISQVQQTYLNIRDTNTQSFLSRVWAWLTRPIVALVKWVKSKFNKENRRSRNFIV